MTTISNHLLTVRTLFQNYININIVPMVYTVYQNFKKGVEQSVTKKYSQYGGILNLTNLSCLQKKLSSMEFKTYFSEPLLERIPREFLILNFVVYGKGSFAEN